jgi:hypothetical protein
MVNKSAWGKRLIEAGLLTVQPIPTAPSPAPVAAEGIAK